MICPLILTTLSRRNVILKLASSSNVRTPRYPPPLMKLPPTCTFNFTPSSLFLPVPPPLCVCLLPSFLSQQSPFTFFFLFSSFFCSFFFLNLLNDCSQPCIASSPCYKPLGSYSFSTRPVLRCYRLFPYRRFLRLSFDDRLPSSRPRIPCPFHGNIENSL